MQKTWREEEQSHRERVWEPGPQVLEQELHDDHVVKFPSAERKIRSEHRALQQIRLSYWRCMEVLTMEREISIR